MSHILVGFMSGLFSWVCSLVVFCVSFVAFWLVVSCFL